MGSALICREATEDSVLGNLALAQAFARDGKEVSVVFTGEALRALDTGTFQWSRNFKTREAQAQVIGAAEEAGLPLSHPDLDPRWSDVRNLVLSTKDNASVRLIACPLWVQLLKLDGRLAHLERITEPELVELLQNADTVVGGY